jgi:acyl carrier protein
LLSRAVTNLNGSPAGAIIPLLTEASDPLPALAQLYVCNGSIDWAKYYKGQQCQRVEVPTYSFEKTRCWITEPLQDIDSPIDKSCTTAAVDLRDHDPAVSSSINRNSGWSTQEKLAQIWSEVLKVEAPAMHDDYFELGGNSLISTQIINRIENMFGVQIEFEVFYDHPTIEGLAKYIEGLRSVAAEISPPESKSSTYDEIVGLLKQGDNDEMSALLDELIDEVQEVKPH